MASHAAAFSARAAFDSSLVPERSEVLTQFLSTTPASWRTWCSLLSLASSAASRVSSSGCAARTVGRADEAHTTSGRAGDRPGDGSGDTGAAVRWGRMRQRLLQECCQAGPPRRRAPEIRCSREARRVQAAGVPDCSPWQPQSAALLADGWMAQGSALREGRLRRPWLKLHDLPVVRARVRARVKVRRGGRQDADSGVAASRLAPATLLHLCCAWRRAPMMAPAMRDMCCIVMVGIKES